jgi:hypothetical protein
MNEKRQKTPVDRRSFADVLTNLSANLQTFTNLHQPPNNYFYFATGKYVNLESFLEISRKSSQQSQNESN